MPSKLLSVEIDENLYDEFINFATNKSDNRKWRSRRDTSGGALQSAVAVALREFLDKHRSKELNSKQG